MSDKRKPFRVILASGNEIKFVAEKVSVRQEDGRIVEFDAQGLRGDYMLFLNLDDVVAIVQEVK